MTYANGASQSDKNGNLLTETDALGNKVQYAYTPEGWLESITRADGTVLTFEYDKTGSLLVQNVGDGQTVESSYNEIGMVTEVSSAEGTIVYQYNGQGYLVSVTNVNGDVVSYTYDAYGNKTSMTYPDGRTVSYTYDRMNRMTSVTGLDGDVTRYAYDAAGRRVETASSTLTTAYSYDSVGNLLTQATSGASEIAFSYSYNKNGYITGEVRTEGGKTTESTYAYDALGQLTSFLQSTGYEEQYAYDKAGNMTEKVLTGTDGIETALKMSYNKGNQLTTMVNGKDKIAYTYDKNGSMVTKVLTSQAYGKLTDAYAYNALDQLTEYVGYDGYQQEFTYDANGMRLSKSEVGNGNRSTLEELLRGNIAGLPEIVEPTQGQINADEADMPTELEWATTEYLYDLTQEYYQVISETSTSKNGSTTTAYAYGFERIAAYTANSKTSYVYDGRGSVAQTVNAPVAGAAVSSALPDISVKVQSFAYTAFGEQMGGVKVSGFTYNAEAYDAATGMLNLRARQFEPALGRFSQKDIVRGQAISPLSLNRYAYCVNDPLNLGDPSGMLFKELISSAKNLINKVTASAKKAVKTATAYVKAAVQKTVIDHAQLFGEYAKKYYDLDAKTQGIIREAANKLSQIDMSTAKGRVEASAIFISACTLLKGNSGSKATVNTPTAPMPTPAPTPTPSNPQPTPAPTRPEGWDVMFIGPDAAKRLQEYLIPRYNQAAKTYNNLSGKNTFEPIPIDKTLYEKYVKPVGTAINQYVLSPIWQMAVEDWNSIMTSADARYNALINDFSFYNALNYATAGIPDVVVGIYQGYATRYIAFRQDPNVSTFLNWWTSGLSGELETTWNTPMSDPDYWRAVRNLVGVEAGAIGAYNVYTNWIISNHPYTTEWMIQYGNKMGMQYGKVPAGTFDEAFDFENLWDMPEGGEIINGRKYSQHALERMAPDTPEVRAEQYARATEIAKEHGLQPGTYEYSSFVDKYVDPRGIPPSVVEDAIINGTKSPGNKPGTFVYETIDIRVVSNENGDIITVIHK